MGSNSDSSSNSCLPWEVDGSMGSLVVVHDKSWRWFLESFRFLTYPLSKLAIISAIMKPTPPIAV